jgi:excinuclease ABC subunit A
MSQPSGCIRVDTGRLVDIHARAGKGNTLVVEHEEAVIRAPITSSTSGRGGGTAGSSFSAPQRVWDSHSEALHSLGAISPAGRPSPFHASAQGEGDLKLRGIRLHNLRDVDVDVPLGVLCCVTGVSGSEELNLSTTCSIASLGCDGVYGGTSFEEAELPEPAARSLGARGLAKLCGRSIAVGAKPAPTPAVYIGAYDAIREVFGASGGSPPG